MNSNKKIAALLWVLIPRKYRINIEKYLSKQEIEELKNTFNKYKKLLPKKIKNSTMLHQVFYSLISFCIFFVFVHLILFWFFCLLYSEFFVFSFFCLFSFLALCYGNLGNFDAIHTTTV
jgi:hypothetical protein